MESIIKSLADLLLVGGTVGGYAMITIIMMIVGYFKYFKPFLSDFSEIKERIEYFSESHGDLLTIGKDIKKELERSTSKVESVQKTFLGELQADHKTYHTESRNILDGMQKDINTILTYLERLGDKVDDNHKNVMVEIAKLQTRLEFLNQTGNVRGIQK